MPDPDEPTQPSQPERGEPVQIPVPERGEFFKNLNKVAPPVETTDSAEGPRRGKPSPESGISA